MFNPEIARLCNRRKIAHMPGCGSATEISQAEELGVEIVKVFLSAEVGGPGCVKAVLGPMPWTCIMPNTAFTGNAISRQKDRIAFLIFDENIKRHMESVGFDFYYLVFPFTKVKNLDALMKEAFDSGYKDVFVADSLEELADKTGIDPDGLRATVDEYNEHCEKSFDPTCNKSHKLLRPIKTPRFYAGRQLPGAYGSLGGIKINHKTEVLDKNWKKILGLYAAGTDACSIYGDTCGVYKRESLA